MTRERGILFSAAMVRSLLAGTKTQTRRVCKPAESHALSCVVEVPDPQERGQVYNGSHFGNEEGGIVFASQYGGVGDRLAVRETWQYADWTEDGYPFVRYRADDATRLCDKIPSEEWSERLMAIWEGLSGTDNYAIDSRAADRKWRPAIHMPRWASRITLQITEVRVERLQDISEADARAEGIVEQRGGGWGLPAGEHFHMFDPRISYWSLWEAINGPGSVEANPWTWAVFFKKVEAL